MLTLTRGLAATFVGLGLLAMTAVSAEAGGKHYRKGGDNFAAGLAAGLIVGGLIVGSQRRGSLYYCTGYCNGRYYYGKRRYYRPYPVYRSRPYYRPGPRYYRPGPRYYRPAPVYRGRLNQAHYNYCFSRYRSYRASDNTFQPYHGPRKPCRSPYL